MGAIPCSSPSSFSLIRHADPIHSASHPRHRSGRCQSQCPDPRIDASDCSARHGSHPGQSRHRLHRCRPSPSARCAHHAAQNRNRQSDCPASHPIRGIRRNMVWPLSSPPKQPRRQAQDRRILGHIYVIRLDVDAWHDQLKPLGFVSDGIPAVFAIDPAGKATGPVITGGAWGEDIPENMAPPLKTFFRANLRKS